MAEKAYHVVTSTTRFGLTQVLGMRETSPIFAAIALAVLLFAGPVRACSYPEPKTFRELIGQSSSILIIRLESAQVQKSGLVHGKIRIVQTLRSPKIAKPQYSSMLFSTKECGGVRLDVGHYFLIATDAYGTTIKLAPSDQSIIDITSYYDESRPAVSARTDLLQPIHDFLAGKPLPKNFPPALVMDYTSTVPPPPPPPRR